MTEKLQQWKAFTFLGFVVWPWPSSAFFGLFGLFGRESFIGCGMRKRSPQRSTVPLLRDKRWPLHSQLWRQLLWKAARKLASVLSLWCNAFNISLSVVPICFEYIFKCCCSMFSVLFQYICECCSGMFWVLFLLCLRCNGFNTFPDYQ